MINDLKSQNMQDASLPVVVLAGGLGTRLRSVVADKPKILAPIKGIPFIKILLNWLTQQKVNTVVFSLGYKSELVIQELEGLKENYDIDISYVIEKSPLGTLGGLSYTLSKKQLKECLVINGDTFVDVDLNQFSSNLKQRKCPMAIGVVNVENVARFGHVKFKNSLEIESFIEKDSYNTSSGWINSGVYYFSADTIREILKFSSGNIEKDYLIPRVNYLHYYKIFQGRFVDIGTPDSYKLAGDILSEYCI